jgi:hypothetical protein
MRQMLRTISTGNYRQRHFGYLGFFANNERCFFQKIRTESPNHGRVFNQKIPDRLCFPGGGSWQADELRDLCHKAGGLQGLVSQHVTPGMPGRAGQVKINLTILHRSRYMLRVTQGKASWPTNNHSRLMRPAV